MLEYENQMFLDSLHEDGLLISAKGLGVETVFCNMVKVYCDPGNLVFVLGTNNKEEDYIISELKKENTRPLPRVITSDYSISEREHIYSEGGVLFISSRIIVVDLLKRRVPIKQISGFLVYRAHKILESCQDGFALRLYRLENKTGFIKAFSSSAESFTRGFARVERVMKTLFLRNLYLWPRFHAVVNSSLEKCKPRVIELHLQLTPRMLQLQISLLDLMNFVIREIKRINPVLDTNEVTVENAVSRSFHKLLQLQLDPVWHQLSSTTKQLLADLKTLRHILLSLTQMDCVRFNNLAMSVRSSEYAHRSSGWVLLDSAETLFVTAERRLYNAKQEACPESNPKWEALNEILNEIRTTSGGVQTVLILVNEAATCRQLKDFLIKGSKQLLSDLYERYAKKKPPSHNAAGNVAHAGSSENVECEELVENCVTLSQSHDPQTGDVCFAECNPKEDEETSSATVTAREEPVIIIEPFKKDANVLSLLQTLQMHKPRYIVMYDVDVTAIRQIEVFQCRNSELQIVVYFPMYAGAIEEQAYLTTLRRERNAFEFLIEEKRTMVIPAEQDGKSGDCAELCRDVGTSSTSELLNTRKGGAATSSASSNPLVIVDMREFRSELPVLLHRRGIDIDPVTLQVGDYILSPDMCVERKSINDLIGSLNSGRLYQQALAMTRYYAKPMLLIEFDQNKPFDLQGRYYLSKDLQSTDITSKLQLLTLHFPKLKIVWSPSPYATAQLFHEIKEGRSEPNAADASAVGSSEANLDEDKYNVAIKDLVGKLPGVTSQNIFAILNKVENLEELLSFTQVQLKDLLQNSANATQLFNALHQDMKSGERASSSVKRSKPKGFRAIARKKQK
ncbi:DNA repair endonuclease XPF isoform X2 [Planococcus citri]|uniref:DNA repair endonuclease XPF isoform X2 n=1 Tax=Planococcus citri TaxID=170843 RepID=UPI0031F807FC